MKRRAVFLGLLIFILSLQSACAADNVGSMRLNQVQQRGGQLTMYVNMLDAMGLALPGNYTPEQFSIAVDGKMVNVDSLEQIDPQTQGIHFVFSVDVSGSLTSSMMSSVRKSLTQFVNSLGPKDTVSFLTFGEEVTQKIVNSADRAAVLEIIDGLRARESMTALYKGVLDAVEIAASTGGRSAIIVLTDGKNAPTQAMKTYTKDSIFSSVMAAQVPLYCIGLNDKGGVDQESLIELATATGGNQFIIKSQDAITCMDNIRNIIISALTLHATLTNDEGKAGFDEINTFKVGYQPVDGNFVTSNELQQVINWKVVPTPAPVVTATPVPMISLELDTATVAYSEDGQVLITGVINVEQGVIDDVGLISVNVNGEPWRIEAKRNGQSFTFSASGYISESTDALQVQAEVRSMGIASRIQHVAVEMPTPEPSATPAPVLSVELDDAGRNIPIETGETISIRGVINVQGVIQPEDLTMTINGLPCEMVPTKLNDSQYEFDVSYTVEELDTTELYIQVQLDEVGISSREQRLYLETPAPTALPEIMLSLDRDGVTVAEDGVTITGSIEVSGEVAPEDISLYVNKARLDMELEQLEPGIYSFTAHKEEVGEDLTQMNIRAHLLNAGVRSEEKVLALWTPTPSPTPTQGPTPTPPPTTPPTAKPTETFTPATQQEATGFLGLAQNQLWILIAGGVALLAAAVFMLLVRKNRQNNRYKISQLPSGFADTPRGNDMEAEPTISTVSEIGTEKGEVDFIDESHPAGGSQPGGLDGAKNGSTVRLEDFPEQGNGTERLDEDESNGTERLDEDEEQGMEFTLVETSKNKENERHRLFVALHGELSIGRSNYADLVIDDSAVSEMHMSINYDGENLFVTDLRSTNGTKLNNQPVSPDKAEKVNHGDTIKIGRTKLQFQFDAQAQ